MCKKIHFPFLFVECLLQNLLLISSQEEFRYIFLHTICIPNLQIFFFLKSFQYLNMLLADLFLPIRLVFEFPFFLIFYSFYIYHNFLMGCQSLCKFQALQQTLRVLSMFQVLLNYKLLQIHDSR